MFLVENVKGLATHDNGKTLQVMLSVFEEVGYTVKWQILNSLDYSVAQKRHRIVIIGTRKDIKQQLGIGYEFPKAHKKN